MPVLVKKAAHARFLRIGDRKLRQVARLINGLNAEKALDQLNFMAKRKLASTVAKTLKSAVANAIETDIGSARLHPEDLTVSKVAVETGPIARRMEFRAMGRANRIQKRYCHLTVEVSGRPTEQDRASRRGKAKSVTKKASTRKSASKKAAKSVTKKTAAKKTIQKKVSTKQADGKKTTAKKSTVKKAVAKKATAKKSASAETGAATGKRAEARTGLGTKREKKSDKDSG